MFIPRSLEFRNLRFYMSPPRLCRVEHKRGGDPIGGIAGLGLHEFLQCLFVEEVCIQRMIFPFAVDQPHERDAAEIELNRQVVPFVVADENVLAANVVGL